MYGASNNLAASSGLQESSELNYQDALQHGNNAGLKVMQRQKKRGINNP